MKPDDIAVNLVKMNGDNISLSRLQREAFLLDRCGASFKLTFIYHHGGPYSFDLAEGWENAWAEERIKVEEEKTPHDTPYWVASWNDDDDDDDEPSAVGSLSADNVRSYLEKIAGFSDLVLELAAAFVYLKDISNRGDAVEELKIRKPLTTRDNDYLRQAVDLLSHLGLEASELLADLR